MRRAEAGPPLFKRQMNRTSSELLKIAGRLEASGRADEAERLALLAEQISGEDRLLTVVEAARWLNCGRRTLDNLVSERRIPAHLIGGRYRFDKLEILRQTEIR